MMKNRSGILILALEILLIVILHTVKAQAVNTLPSKETNFQLQNDNQQLKHLASLRFLK